jgi:hypothetical protein
LELPFTAVEALATAAVKRQKAGQIARINAVRIAGLAPKDYKAAIRDIERA